MSQSSKTGLEHRQEILNILRKCNPNIKPADVHFQSLESVWNYLAEEEKNIDAKLDLYKSKNIDLQDHMEQLHQYNNIKDITQQVLGNLANLMGISVNEVHCKFNLEDSA
ncbi:DNA repair protein SWI5 homolog [Lycorma delicatula]|uniref:DNA repair protein SWI5 homolog n=1 Tax=Lycorma delicatula TaxID=130591 RepID=UPI003F51717B